MVVLVMVHTYKYIAVDDGASLRLGCSKETTQEQLRLF